jgi:hypothetical protein
MIKFTEGGICPTFFVYIRLRFLPNQTNHRFLVANTKKSVNKKLTIT